MELSTQHPFSIPGGLGGRGRFAGMMLPNGVQEVTMGETGVGQLSGTNADAELEELCNSLPGWHQQQSSHDPGGLLGGLARTVSAPSAFLLSASRGARSPGIHCHVDGLSGLSTAPHQENYSGHFQSMGEFSSVQRQAPVAARWLLQGQPTVGNSPLQNSNFATAEVTDAGSLSAGTHTHSTDDQPWPPRPAHWSTMLPPGERHTTAMLHSLVHTNSFEPGDQNEATGCLNGQPSSRNVGRAVQHIPNAGGGAGAGAGSSSGGGGGGSQRSSHFGNLNTGISDWPSAGRVIGGSSGLQIMPGASGSASVLSGPVLAARQANSCSEPLRSGGAPCAVDLAVCTTTRGSPAPSNGAMLTAPLRIHGGGGPRSPELQMGPSAAGGAGLQIMDAMAEGEVMAEGEMMAEGAMQLDMEHDGHGGGGLRSASSGSSMCAAMNGTFGVEGGATGYPGSAAAAAAAGFGGGPNGDMAAVAMAGDGDDDGDKATAGGNGGNANKGGKSANGADATGRGGSSDGGRTPGEVDAPCGEGGLQLLAMRFRNRPGRVPKAVAKLGPIAELAKSAASGKIKLEREELEDLVMTVETSLARAVTEQKEDSRARNRVAQQRFRNRQRETIAALQAKVEEQEALIITLQEKIRWYEAAQQQQRQQQQQPPQVHQREGGAPLRGGRATRRALHD